MMGENPSEFKGDSLPVEKVSWNDCQEFLKRIQQYAPRGLKFQLPSEAHWEYACRAGTSEKYNCPDAKLESYAWYDWNSEKKTHSVESKNRNDWGLYDMHGNVWKWRSDWYEKDYSDGGSCF